MNVGISLDLLLSRIVLNKVNDGHKDENKQSDDLDLWWSEAFGFSSLFWNELSFKRSEVLFLCFIE